MISHLFSRPDKRCRKESTLGLRRVSRADQPLLPALHPCLDPPRLRSPAHATARPLRHARGEAAEGAGGGCRSLVFEQPGAP